ncbi:MAG: fused MFS/spermidine synthase [Burkholderiales bacterium]|nr:fused MFS/spermidine synthase [Burkholderiales bacterium]
MPEFEDSRPFIEANDLKPALHTDDDSLTMLFDMSVIQSRMRLDDPIELDLQYTRAMMGFVMLNPAPTSILVIGLGGGSLPKYCHAHFTQADITVVEINPHVIEMRDAFKVPPDGERFRVVCGDGAAFVTTAKAASYDVIMVDGFSYDGQPEDLCSLAFYKACRKALSESGILAVNLLDKEPECSRLIGRVWQVFGEAVMALDIECGGNRIVMASTVDMFRQCAASFGRRWAELSVAHKETLRFTTASIEYELEPWRPTKPKVSRPPKRRG